MSFKNLRFLFLFRAYQISISIITKYGILTTNQGCQCWLGEPKCTETGLKSPRYVPFGANLSLFGCQILHSCPRLTVDGIRQDSNLQYLKYPF